MTKQEEIRRELYIRSLKYFKDFQDALYNGGESCPTQCLVDELLEYLHSKGVVIKVERELPPSMANEVDWSGKVNWQAGYDHAEARYRLAGYEAVEPLVKESTPDLPGIVLESLNK